jgi:V/A-type H+-transporting ATPase subunit A
VQPWWEKVNAQWAASRQQALDLLKKEQRLAEIVRLIGPDALPDDQKLILQVAEIIKDGFLQQNSFDEVDMYCVPAKQVRILELIMLYFEKAHNCIRLGATLPMVNSHSIREGLSRLKSGVKNDDLSPIDTLESLIRKDLDEVEHRYRTKIFDGRGMDTAMGRL